MSLTKLLYVGQSVADDLYDEIEEHTARYLDRGFEDLVEAGNWSIPSNTFFDPVPIGALDPTKGPDAEVANSLRVWAALNALTPAMACENRIWVRLSHVEAISFCRERWLGGSDKGSLTKQIRTHFFANTRTRARDDHALSRLWWNAWLARQAGGEGKMEQTLRILLSSADVRSNLIERPWIFSRTSLATRIIALLARDVLPAPKEKSFRDLMKAVNLLGAGIVFEAMTPEQIDDFLDHCLTYSTRIA